MGCSTPGFPVLHYLPKFTQTHVLNQWCYLTIFFCTAPFSFGRQFFPASQSFPKSQLFAIGGQNIETSASVLSMNIQDRFPLDWLIRTPCCLRDSLKSLLSPEPQFKRILPHLAFFMVQLSHPYRITGKNISLTVWTFVGKVMFLLFSMLSMFVIAFLSKEQESFNFMAAVTVHNDFGAPTGSTFSPSVCHKVMGPDAMIFDFWMLSFKPT